MCVCGGGASRGGSRESMLRDRSLIMGRGWYETGRAMHLGMC